MALNLGMSIDDTWKQYTSNLKDGESRDFAGGTISRGPNGVMFQNAKGDQSVIGPEMSVEQITNRIPEFAKQWGSDFGYQRSPDVKAFSQLGSGFDGSIVAKNEQFRGVDLNGAKSAQDLFNRIAGTAYTGGLTLDQIAAIGEEAGGVGQYTVGPDGKYHVSGAYASPRAASQPGGQSGNGSTGGGGGVPGGGSNAGPGGGGGVAPGGGGQDSGRNPYLQQMGAAIQAQSNQNLQQNILPGIGQGAQAAGMYGSSRQGTAEGMAMGNAQTGVNSALANMYLNGYGQDQNYNLGLGNLALGNKNADQNFMLGNKNSDQGFYTQQRGQDLQQVGLGASLFGQGNQGMLNQGQGIYNLGLTGQQAPWQSMQNFGSVSQPYTGFGSSSQNQSGSAGAGFLGGALAGSQAYNIFGGNSGPMGVQNTGGFTNTPNYLRF
jgi:hypothetical protein